MTEPTRLNFRRPRFVINTHPIDREAYQSVVEVPSGGGFVGVRAGEGGTLVVLSLSPVMAEQELVEHTLLVVRENVPFEVEEVLVGRAILEDGTVAENARVAAVEPIGMCVVEELQEDGTLVKVAYHVLEMDTEANYEEDDSL